MLSHVDRCKICDKKWSISDYFNGRVKISAIKCKLLAYNCYMHNLQRISFFIPEMKIIMDFFVILNELSH